MSFYTFLLRARNALLNALGVLLLAWAGVLLLGWAGLTHGVWVGGMVAFLRAGLGWGVAYVVLVLALSGVYVLARAGEKAPPPEALPWGKITVWEVALLASLGLADLAGGHALPKGAVTTPGGAVGWGLVEFLRLVLGRVGAWGGLLVAVALAPFVGTPLGGALMARLRGWLFPEEMPPAETPVVTEAPRKPRRRKRPRPNLPPEFRREVPIARPDDEPPSKPRQRDDRLPPLTLLLDEAPARADERHIHLAAGLIEKTLAEFGLPARVVGVQVGPTVVQFAVEPGYIEKPGPDGQPQRQKVRVAQIAALQRDLALALSAERLRVQAPVPGRSYVGIEIPNRDATVVRLRPLMASEAFRRLGSPLALALGRDVAGRPVVADLAKMPHLLIAGATGSGKSVCIAALTTCLVMNNTPADLRLVMIDPKRVELLRFNGLPHLLGQVESDMERVLASLRWVVAEMERRYRLLEQHHARHLASYNRKIQRKGGEPLPYIVVLIDELADLMMFAPDQVEHNIVRLAQMARATGIHLIVATQRPSTDVVTGLIKANFPARLSFAVASGTDSRVILDTPGAEHLLGKGDMLFQPPDAPAPVRAQGALVSDKEVQRVMAYWQKQAGESQESAPWERLLAEGEAVSVGYDPLLEEAARVVIRAQRASASMLQRRLRVGYPRAARLIEQLEEVGVVASPAGAGKEREVLLGPDDEFRLEPPDAA